MCCAVHVYHLLSTPRQHVLNMYAFNVLFSAVFFGFFSDAFVQTTRELEPQLLEDRVSRYLDQATATFRAARLRKACESVNQRALVSLKAPTAPLKTGSRTQLQRRQIDDFPSTHDRLVDTVLNGETRNREATPWFGRVRPVPRTRSPPPTWSEGGQLFPPQYPPRGEPPPPRSDERSLATGNMLGDHRGREIELESSPGEWLWRLSTPRQRLRETYRRGSRAFVGTWRFLSLHGHEGLHRPAVVFPKPAALLPEVVANARPWCGPKEQDCRWSPRSNPV